MFTMSLVSVYPFVSVQSVLTKKKKSMSTNKKVLSFSIFEWFCFPVWKNEVYERWKSETHYPEVFSKA